MVKEMQRTHKNLYHSISAESFAAMIQTLDAKILSLTRAEVIVEMAKIVAAIGDGHTNIYPTRDPKIGFRTLPVEFTFFGDQLYIRASQNEQRSLLGAKVLRIGNLSTEDAGTAIKTMIGHENEGGARYWAEYLLAMPEVLQALHITSRIEDVPLTLATEHGATQVTLHPSAPVEVMSGDISTLFYRARVGPMCVIRTLDRTLGGSAKSMSHSTLSMMETYSTYRSIPWVTVRMRRWPILLSVFMMRSLPLSRTKWQLICGKIGVATIPSYRRSFVALSSRRALIDQVIFSGSSVQQHFLPRRISPMPWRNTPISCSLVSQPVQGETPMATRERSSCPTAASRFALRFTTGRTGIQWISATRQFPRLRLH